MIRLPILFALALTATLQAQTQTAAITGNVRLGDEWLPKVYLLKISHFKDVFSGSDQLVIDSCAIDPTGRFSFPKAAFSSTRSLYRLQFALKNNPQAMINGVREHNVVYALLSNKDSLVLHADSDYWADTYRATSNVAPNQELQQILNASACCLHEGNQLKQAMETHQGHPAFDSIVATGFQRIQKMHQDVIFPMCRQAALETQTPEVAAVALSYMECMHYLQLFPDTITQMVRTLGQKFPNHPMIMEIEGMVASQQAATFPDLTAVRLPDVQGASTEITMESAALTILDFWASWCGPCKVEAKASLLPLHKQYNDKGLKIIGISTDTDSTKWKNALEKEHYPWINVWDHENTYANLFAVKSLPTIVVLDKNGHVIAYDLRGESLNQFVRDHFAMMGNK